MIPILGGGGTRRNLGIRYVGRRAETAPIVGAVSLTYNGFLTNGEIADTTVSTGDLLIGYGVSASAASGWTVGDGGPDGTATVSEGLCYIHLSYKVVGASAPSMSFYNAGSRVAPAVIVAFKGTDTTTPMDATIVTAQHNGTLIPNPGAITPVTSGARVFALGGVWCNTSGVTSQTLGSGLSNNFGSFVQNGTMAYASGTYAWTSGAYDPPAFTLSAATDNASSDACSITLAVRPAT